MILKNHFAAAYTFDYGSINFIANSLTAIEFNVTIVKCTTDQVVASKSIYSQAIQSFALLIEVKLLEINWSINWDSN